MNPPEGNPVVVDAATGVVRNATREEAADLDHDGVLPEPRRLVSDILWVLRQLILGAGIVWLLAVLGLLAFTPDAPKGVVDAATLVAVVGLLINSFMQGFGRRQN